MTIVHAKTLAAAVAATALIWQCQFAQAEEYRVGPDAATACKSGEKSETMTLEGPREVSVARANERKASTLYAEVDRTGFYRGTAQKESRSLMNVTFRLPSEELEKAFEKEATAAGLDGLKGHRLVGGMRASIYNAFPQEGVDALVQFMREFEKKKG